MKNKRENEEEQNGDRGKWEERRKGMMKRGGKWMKNRRKEENKWKTLGVRGGKGDNKGKRDKEKVIWVWNEEKRDWIKEQS